MAEPTISLDYDDIAARVGDKIGIGRTSSNWDTDETAVIDDCIQDGYRDFLTAHEWRFLKPIASVVCWASASGTMTVVGQTTVRDLTNTPFYPTMVGQTIVSTNGSYVIDTYVSSGTVTVATDATADNGEAFTISPDGAYRLPDDFGGTEGDLTYNGTLSSIQLRITSESRIRAWLARSDSPTGRPEWAALRPVTDDVSTAQRWDLVIYPLPDDDYTFDYQKIVNVNKLATTEYPLGGTRHATTVLHACLAAAERRLDDAVAVEDGLYQRYLARSVKIDQMTNSPEYMGRNTDPNTQRWRDRWRCRDNRTQTVRYLDAGLDP